MAKRKRDIQLKFRVTPQEREMIETKMLAVQGLGKLQDVNSAMKNFIHS